MCKTAPSPYGLPLAAAVFVGNRAGVTSAQEKFHYKVSTSYWLRRISGPIRARTLLQSGPNNWGPRTPLEAATNEARRGPEVEVGEQRVNLIGARAFSMIDGEKMIN